MQNEFQLYTHILSKFEVNNYFKRKNIYSAIISGKILSILRHRITNQIFEHFILNIIIL